MIKALLSAALLFAIAQTDANAQTKPYNGLEGGLHNLFRLSNAKTRSISPENFTGEKGKGGMSLDGPAKKD